MIELGAVIWDYDGTLANTWERNFSVTRDIIHSVLCRDPDSIGVLSSIERYSDAMAKWINWREFYGKGLGLSEDEIDRVGPCWTSFQKKNSTPVHLYEDAVNALNVLADYPQGIVSQNAKSAITGELNRSGILERFHCIIGYEEVPIRRQKPDPEGLLLCIRELMGRTPGIILFIGDHETDVQCAVNAHSVLSGNGVDQDVVSGILVRENGPNPADWATKPDLKLRSDSDIIGMIKGLARTSHRVSKRNRRNGSECEACD